MAQVYTKRIQARHVIFHGIPQKSTAFTFLYHAIENNSGQNNQCDTLMAHDGEVGCNTIKCTRATAFLYSDWLYFLWHGINCFISLLS